MSEGSTWEGLLSQETKDGELVLMPATYNEATGYPTSVSEPIQVKTVAPPKYDNEDDDDDSDGFPTWAIILIVVLVVVIVAVVVVIIVFVIRKKKSKDVGSEKE